jgi:hypothetical protein
MNERESREHFDVKVRQKKCPLWGEVCPCQGQGKRVVEKDEVVTVDKTTKDTRLVLARTLCTFPRLDLSKNECGSTRFGLLTLSDIF